MSVFQFLIYTKSQQHVQLPPICLCVHNHVNQKLINSFAKPRDQAMCVFFYLAENPSALLKSFVVDRENKTQRVLQIQINVLGNRLTTY